MLTLYELHKNVGPMIKTNILRYTWLNIERVEAMILLDHGCEVLIVDSLIES